MSRDFRKNVELIANTLKGQADEALALANKLSTQFAGPPARASAALAELTSRWLAGITVKGDQEATDRAREESFQHWIRTVRMLTEVNAHVFDTNPSRKMSGEELEVFLADKFKQLEEGARGPQSAP